MRKRVRPGHGMHLQSPVWHNRAQITAVFEELSEHSKLGARRHAFCSLVGVSRLAWMLAVCLLSSACSQARPEPVDGEAGASSSAGAAGTTSESYEVELGVPGGEDGLDFM